MDNLLPPPDMSSGDHIADTPAPDTTPEFNSQGDLPAAEGDGLPDTLPGVEQGDTHPDIVAPSDRGAGRVAVAAEVSEPDLSGIGEGPNVNEGHEVAHHGGRESSFDEFIAEHTAEITEKLDGPEGFFAKAREEGFGERVTSDVAEAIDRADDAALGRLGVTKEELKLIAGAYEGGQERTNLREVKTPGELSVSDDVAHTDVGDIPLDRNPETGEQVVPRGCYVKSKGELWAVTPRLEDRYPNPAERRIATAWSYAHEMGHGIVGRDLMDVLTESPGRPITLPDGTPTDTTTQLEHILAAMPDQPLTDYSGSYRREGRLPSREEAPIGYIRAVEEELCEIAASKVLGFAPNPGTSADTTLNNLQHRSEQLHGAVWDYMRAAPRTN